METAKMEQTVLNMAREMGWKLDPFEDLCGVMEELGEACREVRRIEKGRERPDEVEPDRAVIIEHMEEEIGDLLFPLIKVAAHYGITLEGAFYRHLAKMEERYRKEEQA